MSSTGTPTTPYEGYLSNENRGLQIIAVNASMIGLILTAISLRFYSRSIAPTSPKPVPRYWWDDWVILAVTPIAILNPALSAAGTHFGNGQHIWNVSSQNQLALGKIYFTTVLLMKISLTIAKASALLFYARIFSLSRSPPWFRIGIYLAHAINIAWGTSFVLSLIFQCQPIAKAWDSNIEGKCISVSSLFIASAVTCVFMDLFILLLPLPRVWALQIARQRRLVLSVIFFCGYCVSLISIGRLIETCLERKALTSDYTYDAVPFQCWAACETPVTIFSVCIPAMSRLGNRFPRAITRVISFDFSSKSDRRKERIGSNGTDHARIYKVIRRSDDFASSERSQKAPSTPMTHKNQALDRSSRRSCSSDQSRTYVLDLQDRTSLETAHENAGPA